VFRLLSCSERVCLRDAVSWNEERIGRRVAVVVAPHQFRNLMAEVA